MRKKTAPIVPPKTPAKTAAAKIAPENMKALGAGSTSARGYRRLVGDFGSEGNLRRGYRRQLYEEQLAAKAAAKKKK